MRQSLISSRGDVTTFVNPVEHPIALICIILAIALMLYPVFLNYRRKRAAKGAEST
jgi:TctA family transporter